MISTAIFWIIVCIIVIAVDILTSNFLFSWFAVGALLALIASATGVEFTIQIIIFLVTSIITIAIGYPITKKKFKDTVKRLPLMEEKYIGKVMVAEEDIIDKGRVKLEGSYWTVENKGVEIKKGDKFVILSIEGIKLSIIKEEI